MSTLFDELTPRSVHCATITDVGGGELLAACYAFSYETSPDSIIVTSRFRDGAWGPIATPIDYPGIAVGNPVLYMDSEGIVHLFFVVVMGEGWTDAYVVQATSRDGGRSWGNANRVHERRGLMTKTRPIEVDGRLLLPVYDEGQWCSMVLVRERDGIWRLHGDTTSRGRTLQPAIVARSDGCLDMYSRGRTGRVFHALSVDGGYSWTASRPTELPNPNAGVEALRTQGGALMLIGNPATMGRERLAFQVSHDDGRSWSEPLDIETVDDGELSYPYAILDTQGFIQLLYTRQRTEIVHVVWSPGSLDEGEMYA
ncbi:MAG: sialidase family protein [Trueperaceae bacterium]|nr:sialidase family protein [Trueperaceae bacterium]